MLQLSILYPDCSSDSELIETAFANTLFIHLTRTDKLAQAISFVKATQTGLWHATHDGVELERLSEPKEPVYDENAIESQLAKLKALDGDWESWFAREGIEPLCITYENLSTDPTVELARILGQLGLDSKLACGLRPDVAKLADATNQRWMDRYRSECSAQYESIE